MLKKQTPAAGGAAGATEKCFVGTEQSHIAPAPSQKQASTQRQARELLLIKRGTLWAIAITASSYLDSLIDVLEDPPEFDGASHCNSAPILRRSEPR